MYRIILTPHGKEWVAEIPKLPGCMGAGDTPDEALKAVLDRQENWLEIARLADVEIPEGDERKP